MALGVGVPRRATRYPARAGRGRRALRDVTRRAAAPGAAPAAVAGRSAAPAARQARTLHLLQWMCVAGEVDSSKTNHE